MGRPQGQGKTPGSGRKAGTPNRKTEDLHAVASQLGIHPFKILLHYAAGNWKELGYKNEFDIKYTQQGEPYEVRVIQPEVRVKAAAEASQYLYPKRKQIEIIPEPEPTENSIKSFEEFCESAGYPKPFPKQVEMKDFCFQHEEPRLLLG